MRRGDIKLFTGNANPELAREICDILGLEIGRNKVGRFSDGEISVETYETVRGCDVFVIQPICNPVNDSLMELLIMMDTFRRASAERVTAVIPYYGYARQDRKVKARDPITAKLVADMICTAGANRVLTMDLHTGQLQGFFNVPVDHLLGIPLLTDYYMETGISLEDTVVVSPDLGSVARARVFAERMNLPLAIIDKRRKQANRAEVMNIIGSVRNKRCILVDDMIDTAGTVVQGAEALMKKGAMEVSACCTHGVLSGEAISRLEQSPLQEVVILNTIPLPSEKHIPKINVLSVAKLFAEAIERIYEDLPVSSLFTRAPQLVRPIQQLDFKEVLKN